MIIIYIESIYMKFIFHLELCMELYMQKRRGIHEY